MVPVVHENSLFWIKSLTKFVATGLLEPCNKTKAIPDKTCHVFNVALIFRASPRKFEDKHNMCEATILNDTVTNNCISHNMNVPDVWITINFNCWIFVLSSPRTITVGNNTIPIEGSGNLSWEDGITSNVNNQSFISHDQDKSLLVADFNLSTFISEKKRLPRLPLGGHFTKNCKTCINKSQIFKSQNILPNSQIKYILLNLQALK